MGMHNLRRAAGRLSWRIDRHGRWLGGRVDGLRDRVSELENAVLARNGRTNERLRALELGLAGFELEDAGSRPLDGGLLLLADRPVERDERITRLEARIARLEARLDECVGPAAHDEARLDDFLVLVGSAFESLALGSERLRFKNPR